MAPKSLGASKKFVARYDVASTTTDDSYVVSQKYDGTWACSCPYWKFHKAPKPTCKHIVSTINFLKVPVKRQVDVFAESYFGYVPLSVDRQTMLRFAEAYANKYAKVEPVVAQATETVTGEFKITRKFRAVEV